MVSPDIVLAKHTTDPVTLMRYFLCMLFSLVLLSCGSPILEQRLTDESINWYAVQIKQLKDFEVVECDPQIEDDLTKLSLTVVSKQELDQINARISLVESVEEFVRYFNKDKEIRPFLHIFPFSYQQMEFTILFHPQNSQFAIAPNIAKAALVDGNVLYYTAEENTGAFHVVYEENYLQAWEIVSSTCWKH
jgi:hypothetical protein